MLEIGTITQGKVVGLTNFGAFVQLPDGSNGMVHISEVSTSFVSDIADVLQEGQEVKVKVIGINEKGKISLSIKQTDEGQKPLEHKKRKRAPANVWQGVQQKPEEEMTFEDMMSKFKKTSEEKIVDLKHSKDAKRGGYSRRSKGNKF